MEEQQLLQEILQELKTLNSNFSQYTQYSYDRDATADEKAEQEEEDKAQQEQAQADQEQQQRDADQNETATTLSTLTDIHSTLSDFEDAYKNTTESSTVVNDNLLFNSNMQFILSTVGVGLLGILFGSFLARVIFRKL